MLGSSLITSEATTPLKSGIQTLKENLSPKSPSEMFGLTPGRNQAGSPASPVPQTGATFLSSVDYALNAPTLPQKCSELTYLLNNCPQKDLPTAFHRIVDKTFGLTFGGRGFGINSILKTTQPREFFALADFLGSNGPVLRSSFKLLSDPYLRFDFPISLLSTSTKQQIETGTASQFIMSKLSAQNSVLLLNSYEFYMFTFIAYIVQPYTADNKFLPGDSLYPNILEDYFSYFLPCDGSAPPPLPFHLSMSSPTHIPEINTPAPSPSRKSLLRHGPLLSTPARSIPTSPTISSMTGHEVWRSETLINICSELLLSPFSPPSKSKSESPSLNQKTNDLVIAVGDTLRIVRMMIKHLHFFSNSGGPLDLTPLDQLKRCVIPNIKKKVYVLFKFIFSHWPHDTSFRLVLETWLSYIQPWRYTDSAARVRGTDETGTMSIEDKWLNFVAENILFYTNILRLLLPRFFRMDLTTSKNAYMLFRISKIYSQAGLANLVKNGESGLDRIMSVVDFSLDRTGFSEMPSYNINLEMNENVISSARQCLLELEGSVRYEPIFGNSFRQTVSEVLLLASRAKQVAEDSISEANKENPENKTLMDRLINMIAGAGAPPQDSSEVEEFRKSVQYLNNSITSLSSIFDLQIPESSSTRRKLGSGSSPGYPEMSDEDAGRVLTPHGRWQVLQGLAKPEVRYGGDPDQVPINQSEIGGVVRLMHRFSSWLNQRYGKRMREMYGEESVLGEISRIVLLPPCRFYHLEKSLDGGPARRVFHSHSARINLRFLAGHRFLTLAALSILVLSFLCKRSLFQTSVLLIIFTAFIIVLVATGRTFVAPTARRLNLDSTLDQSKTE